MSTLLWTDRVRIDVFEVPKRGDHVRVTLAGSEGKPGLEVGFSLAKMTSIAAIKRFECAEKKPKLTRGKVASKR